MLGYTAENNFFMQNTSYSGDFSEWYDVIHVADLCIKCPHDGGEVSQLGAWS